MKLLQRLIENLTPYRLTLTVLLIFAALVVWLLVRLPPNRIVMSTGGTEGAYYEFALEYKARLAQSGITVEILPGPGSIRTLERLSEGRADVGFVQAGLANRVDTEGMTTIGSMFYEPIWLFYRGDLSIERIADLTGRQIAIGEMGSGTRPVALRILQANDVDSENTSLIEMSLGDAADQLIAGEIDAAFFIISPEAEIVSRLIRNAELSLFSFRRVAAYNSLFPYMTSTILGEGVIDFAENIPDEDKTLLAVTANLVVRDGFDSNLARLLAQEADVIHSGGGILERAGEFPSYDFAQLAVNEPARRRLTTGMTWFESNFPFYVAVLLDRLVVLALPLLTAYTLLRAIQPLYMFNVRYQTTRWYTVLREISDKIDTMTLPEVEASIEELRELSDSLTRRVSLPFFFMNSVFILRSHVNNELARLEQRREALLSSQPPADVL